MDANTQEIRAVVVTDNTVGDQTAMPVLLEQIEPEQEVGSATLDGIYDTQICHDTLAQRGLEAVIPARKRARLCKEKTPGLKRRNQIVLQTRELGQASWKKASGALLESPSSSKFTAATADLMSQLARYLRTRPFLGQLLQP